jgi:hypothetical protein
MFGLFKSNKSFEEEMSELDIMEKKAQDFTKPTAEWTPALGDEGIRLLKKVAKLRVDCCKRHGHQKLAFYQMLLDSMNGKPY